MTNEALNDTHIRLPTLKQFREILHFCGYGSTFSVFFQLLAYTGCRINETNKLSIRLRSGNMLYWKVGKNQTGYRKAHIPPFLWEEIEVYRLTHRIYKDALLGAHGKHIVDRFNKQVRPCLSPAWNKKIVGIVKHELVEQEFDLQAKAFRKLYATVFFFRKWKLTGESAIALEWVCQEMKHSSVRMTANHYVQLALSPVIEEWVAHYELPQKQEIQEKLLF